MAEYAQVYKNNKSEFSNSKGKSPRHSKDPASLKKNASFKDEETESQKEIAATLKELSNTVDKLSTKLDDFIENTSEVLSLGSRLPSSRQGPADIYGTLPGSMSTTRSQKYLIKSLNGEDNPNHPRYAIYPRDENPVRGNWSNRMEFFLSALGYVVGMGNIWRFPYKCYVYGGASFFIAYLVMLLLLGIPMFYLELALGQYTSQGPLNCWTFAPMFQGIGWSMFLLSSFLCLYYNVYTAWSLLYLGLSFSELPALPWDNCNSSDWVTGYCYDGMPDVNCSGIGRFSSSNGLCINGTDDTGIPVGVWDENLAMEAGITRQLASEQFFRHYVYNGEHTLGDVGEIQWQLAVSLLGVWVLVFLCVIKGIKSSGKVVYVTVLLPFILLISLLVRGVTLSGHYEGVKAFFTPDWDILVEAKVWTEAATQVYISLFASWGGLITLASYSKFRGNIVWNTIFITVGNCLTSLVGGFMIFSFLGFWSEESGISISNIVGKGFSEDTDHPSQGSDRLAFILFPEAATYISSGWAIVFFLMLLLLGLNTQFVFVETISTSLMDRWPKFFRRRRESVINFSICVVMFFIGLVLCTEGGLYVLELMDVYIMSWPAIFIGLCECIAVTWFYGWKNLSNDIQLMTGSKPWLVWWFAWNIATPLALAYAALFTWVDYSTPMYGDYMFPDYGTAIGWIIALVIVIPIPLGIIIVCCCMSKGSAVERFRQAAYPITDWGPALINHRRLVSHLANFVVDRYGETKRARSELSTSPYGMGSVKKVFYTHNSAKDVTSSFHDIESKMSPN